MTLAVKNPGYPAPAFPMVPRNLTEITDLIIHHSDGALTQTPLDIDAEHRAEGWAMIGYSYVITPNGAIYKGRPDDVVPSAAYGRNTQSVDVCLIGAFEPGTPEYTGMPTQSQLNALKSLAVELHKMYPSITTTIGHGEVATKYYPQDTGSYATACPGSRLHDFLPALRSFISSQIG